MWVSRHRSIKTQGLEELHFEKKVVRFETEKILEYCSYETEEGSIHKDGKETDWKNDFKNIESTGPGCGLE